MRAPTAVAPPVRRHASVRDVRAPFPPTYLVLRFSRNINAACLLWFVNKIREKRKSGGAELLVRRQPLSDSLTKGVTLHLSASTLRVLEVAEELEFKKCDNTGLLREFVLTQSECFLREGATLEDLFTTAEKQRVVRHELENIRVGPGESHLPGYPLQRLYPGQSAFQVLMSCGFIERCFPLHEEEALKKFCEKWYRSLFNSQPYEDIRLYFGENIALYFIFLGYYTTALVPPMVLGLLEALIPHTTTVFFCIFNVLWVTLFLELWKRKSSELAFEWGTLGITVLEEPRPGYRGEMGVDEVTGRYQPKYPKWKTNLKMYCVSFPIVFACLLASFFVMLLFFYLEARIVQGRKVAGDVSVAGKMVAQFPSVVYAGLVYVMNFYYKKLSTFLTNWENHKTQVQFDRYRVTKLVLFEFTNNFMSLFYIAFVIQDLEMLKSQLATMLIIQQGFNNLQEAVFPLLVRSYGKRISKFFKRNNFFGQKSPLSGVQSDNSSFAKEVNSVLESVPLLEEGDPRIEQSIAEARLEPHEGTYDDYLEMFIQFGYVFLFSSVYPMAAFWAVTNNLLEIRADAFKLCRVSQRTMPRRVKDIGAWQKAFEWLGAVSVMTNCGLLCLSPQLRALAPAASQLEWVLLFVFIEHVLFFVRQILNATIHEKPERVRRVRFSPGTDVMFSWRKTSEVAGLKRGFGFLLVWVFGATRVHALDIPNVAGISRDLTANLSVDQFFSLWIVFNEDDVRISDKPFTILAPKNEEGASADVLLSHPNKVKETVIDHVVLGQKLRLDDVSGPFHFRTLGGKIVNVQDVNGTLFANSAKVVEPRVEVPGGGVLVTLDGYLFPSGAEEGEPETEAPATSPASFLPVTVDPSPMGDASNSTFFQNLVDLLSFFKNGVRVFQHFLSKSNVSSLLKNDEEYTVLIPTDHAFQRWHPIDWGFYPFSVPEFTENVIVNHFISENLRQDSIKDGQVVKTLGGREIVFTRNLFFLSANGAPIVRGDTPIHHGNLMFVSEVLFVSEAEVQKLHQKNKDKETPPLLAFPWFGAQFLSHAFLALERQRRFSHITRFLNLADLAPHLPGKGYTFFVPTDEAFETLGLAQVPDNYLAKGQGLSVLLNHFVKGRLYEKDLRDGVELTTLGNETIRVSNGTDGLRVNEAKIVESENFVYNLGTMFYINKVLFADKELLPPIKEETCDGSGTARPATVKPDAETIPEELSEASGTLPDVLLEDGDRTAATQLEASSTTVPAPTATGITLSDDVIGLSASQLNTS